MANMTLIEAKTSTTSSVTFASIPQTYTDLRIVIAARDTGTGSWQGFDIELNSDSTSANYVSKSGYSTGTTTGGQGGAGFLVGYHNTSANTASVFANSEIHIPSYSATIAKSWTWHAVTGNMATDQINIFGLGRWTNTAPITQVKLTTQGTAFASGSTFYLYGVPNTTVAAKATGGTIYSDGVYNYHTFLQTGTFTPTTSLTADVLVIGGGGGSVSTYSGGGGAGGIAYKTGSALTATAYTCTVGAGGAGTSGAQSNSGVASSIAGSGFSTITANGGGGGGYSNNNLAAAGGSGGGGGGYGNITGGASNQGTSGGATGYGNAGGNGVANPNSISGGGGGAGGAGGAGSGTQAGANALSGAGGIGLNTWADWAIATRTGDRGYFAGGGAGGGRNDAEFTRTQIGGLGGGGQGTFSSGDSLQNGMANTGGGAGGSWTGTGGSGGSGIIIIRYTI